jgi:hypothetical protein
MKFTLCENKLPETSGRYLVACERNDGSLFIPNRFRDFDPATGEWAGIPSIWGGKRVVAWSPLPPHVTLNGAGWLSEFRGDDPPGETGWYLASLECPHWWIGSGVDVGIVLYVAEKAHWVSARDVLAYQPAPELKSVKSEVTYVQS